MTTPTPPSRADGGPIPAAGPPPQGDAPGEDAASRAAPRNPRRGTLFSVPFHSQMSDADLAQLRSTLDLVTYLTPKPGVSGARPGMVPLDFWSGLFLERGEHEGEWVLEARTWGSPPESAVHEWHVRAALAARELDAAVQIPPPLTAARPDTPTLPLGRAANKRPARLGRRLAHLE